MDDLKEEMIMCPYCGESIDVLVDPQQVGSDYIEDCQVCCRPIVFAVTRDENDTLAVSVRSEDESY